MKIFSNRFTLHLSLTKSSSWHFHLHSEIPPEFKAGQSFYPVLFHPEITSETLSMLLKDRFSKDEPVTLQLIFKDEDERMRIILELKDAFRIVPAAGGAVLNARNELLLITRHGMADLPKGKMEKDEVREDAAIREVAEETGIRAEIISQLEPTWHIYERNGWVLKPTWWYLMRAAGSDEPVPQTEESITAVRWIPLQALALETPDTYPSIRQVLREVTFAVQTGSHRKIS